MTKTIEVKFAEETNSERKGDSTVLSLKGRPYSEERKLLELDYSIELPLEGGRLFQEENRQLGYVIKKVSGDLEEQTKATYDSILGKLGDRHLYRCWNFVPDINSDTEEIENYKHFAKLSEGWCSADVNGAVEKMIVDKTHDELENNKIYTMNDKLVIKGIKEFINLKHSSTH